MLANVIATQAIGWWNGDVSRFARESLPPVQYLSSSYYAIWFAALEKILAQKGLVKDDEVAAGRALHQAPTPPRVFKADIVDGALRKGWPSSRQAQKKPPGTSRRLVLTHAIAYRLLLSPRAKMLAT